MSKRSKAFAVVIAAMLVMALGCETAARFEAGANNSLTQSAQTTEPGPTLAAEPIDDGFVFELEVSDKPAIGETRQCVNLQEYIAVKVEIDPSPVLRFETAFPDVFSIQLLAFTSDAAQVSMNRTNDASTPIAKGALTPVILDMVGRSDWNAPYRFRSNIPLVIYTGSEGDRACFEIQKTDFVITGVKE